MVELEMVKHSQIWGLFWSRELRIANSLGVTRNREIIFWLEQLGTIYCLDIY